MKPVNQSKVFVNGAFILTISGLIIKILSAFYRIPFQNIVGDVGFYIYQQVYPFYGVAVVLATTGFPVVISKLYAELKEKKDFESARRFLLVAYLFLQLFGFFCFTVLYTSSGSIAFWMKDPHLEILLKVVSFVFLLFPLSALLRGYYQGNGNMIPTAISQVFEQFIRVFTILIVSYIFMQKGYSLYLVGGGAMFGSVTGSMVSAVILVTFLLVRKEWKKLRLSKQSFRNLMINSGWIYKTLIFQGLTICISGMLMIMIQMADSMNLYSLLVSSGIDKEAAKSLKGIFDRGQPLIQIGTVAATSMSLSLVPIIASERLKKNREDLYSKIKLALQISMVVGAGASAGLWAIITPANIMLFKNNQGSAVLGVLSLVILFSSLISTIAAIMQGLEYLLFPAVVIMVGFPMKYVLNLLLVPKDGTMGAAIATIVTLALLSLVMSMKLRKMAARPLYSWSFFKAVLIAVISMVIFLKIYLWATKGLYTFFDSSRPADAIQTVSAVLLGGLLYLWIVIRSKVFKEEDLRYFPFGNKLTFFLKEEDRS